MKNYHSYIFETVSSLSKSLIYAEAELRGSVICPGINGATVFYRHVRENGIFVVSAVFGLPDDHGTRCYEMHVRGGPFPHPLQRNESLNALASGFHKDMLTLPDICGNGGFAFSVFYTEEIARSDLLGRSIAIFPKGSSSQKPDEALASGLILPV